MTKDELYRWLDIYEINANKPYTFCAKERKIEQIILLQDMTPSERERLTAARKIAKQRNEQYKQHLAMTAPKDLQS